MAIANGTPASVSASTLFGYVTRVTPVCRCLQPICGWGIWLRQDSLRHILVSPAVYAPGTIAVNVTWTERGFNACQNASQHVWSWCTHLQPFPSNSTRKFKNSPFLHIFLHILASSRPWEIAVNVTWIERGFNACQLNASLHALAACSIPIYIRPFPSNSSRKFKSSPFYRIFAHFGFPWVRPWDNRGKCHTVGKRIQCL